MSTVIDILANTYGFQDYSERLRQNGSLPPPENKAFDVFLAITHHILPECTYKLHLNQPSAIAVSSGHKRHASIDTQKQFLLKWRVVQKMATVVQIKDFSLADCIQPTPARWLLHRQAIDRYLQFRLYFRSNKVLKPEIDQFSATNREYQAMDTKLRLKLDAYNQQQHTLKQQQETFENEQKLLLQRLQPNLDRLGIVDGPSSDISHVKSELQGKVTQLEQQHSRLNSEADEHSLEKQRVSEAIQANESQIKYLQEQLRLLQMLKATGAAHAMASTSTLTPEIEKIEHQLAEKPRETEKYKSATAAFTEASVVVSRVEAAWERCQQKWKQKPDVDIDELRRRVQSLMRSVKSTEEMYLSTHERLAELQATVQSQRETKADLSSDHPDNAAAVLSRDAKYYSKTDGQRFKDEINQLKSKHDELEVHLKAAEQWLLDMEKAQATGKSIDDIMASMLQWMKFYVDETPGYRPRDPVQEVQYGEVQGREVQDREVQYGEVQDREVQDREVQDREVQYVEVQGREVQDRDVQYRQMQDREVQYGEVPGREDTQDPRIQDLEARDREVHDLYAHLRARDTEVQDPQARDPRTQEVAQDRVHLYAHDPRDPEAQYREVQDPCAQDPQAQDIEQSQAQSQAQAQAQTQAQLQAHSQAQVQAQAQSQTQAQLQAQAHTYAHPHAQAQAHAHSHAHSYPPATPHRESSTAPSDHTQEHTPEHTLHTPEHTEQSPLHIPEYMPRYTPRTQAWKVHIDGPDISSDE